MTAFLTNFAEKFRTAYPYINLSIEMPRLVSVHSRHHVCMRAARTWDNTRFTLFAGVASGYILFTAGCSSSVSDSDSGSSEMSDSVAKAIVTETVAGDTEPYIADYDIAMTVSSVADAINVGEPLDSTDYNFAGVLTDAMGTPLFTDFSGLPGQWEVDVVSENEVHIRNLGTGDLFPETLVEYLSASLAERHEGEMHKVDEYDEGNARISEYSYGHASLRIETRPESLPTGEVGPRLEIILRSDTIAVAPRPERLSRQ